MADEADRANEVVEREIGAALLRMKPAQRDTLSVCVDCGNEIPAARREAIPGVCRCTPCQSLLEEQAGAQRRNRG